MKSKLTGLGLLCAGLIGTGLRLWTLKTAYEPSTKLTISGSVSLIVLIAYAIAIPFLALAFAILLEKKATGIGDLYSGLTRPIGRLGTAAAIVLSVGSFLRLIGNIGLVIGRGTTWPVAVVDGLMLVGSLCMVWMSLTGQEPVDHCHNRPYPLIPGFAGCLALVVFYQNNSRDPVVTHYCWMLLCLMACILALYHQASYAFDNPHPVRTLWATLTAGIYALLALPDAEGASDILLLIGIALWMLQRSMLITAEKRKTE